MRVNRDLFRPRGDLEDLEHIKLDVPSVEYYTWTQNGQLYAKAFGGKRSKPDWYYRFPDEETRANKIKRHTEIQLANAKETARRRAERSRPHSLKVGDTLYCSWGYDQTNIDFYEVTEVVGKHTVRIMPICGRVERSNPPCDYVVPAPGEAREWDVLLRVEKSDTDKTRLKKVRSDNSISLSRGYNAYPWGGDPLYETSSGWGH